MAAFATLAGTIIGVGMFAIPFAVARAGFWPGMVMLGATTVITLYIHAAFGEVVSTAPSVERLAGYARRLIGAGAEHLATLIAVAGRIGALLAYLVAGAVFVNTLLSPWAQVPQGAGFALFFLVGALGVWFGLRFVSGLETLLVLLLVVGVAVLGWLALPHVRLEHFVGWHPGGLPLVYGVMLFALGGIPAIPEARAVATNQPAFRKALKWGTMVPAVVYFAFAFFVVGTGGPATSPDAATGLAALGTLPQLVAAGVGFLAVITSFFVIGLNLAHMFEYDWGWSRAVSRLASIGAPVILFGLGFNDFIRIIGALGAVLGAAEGILVLLLFERWQTVSSRGTVASPYGQSRSDKKRVAVLGIRSGWASAVVAILLVIGAAWYAIGIKTL